MLLGRLRQLSFDALRRRMIRETEAALQAALRYPDRFPRIPTLEVGCGEFDPRFAEHYWEIRLGLDG